MVAVAVFTPAEEVENTLMAPRDMAEKVVKDFFREEWVAEPSQPTLTEGSGEVVVLQDFLKEVVEAAEGTLVEAVEKKEMTPVEEGEDPTTLA